MHLNYAYSDHKIMRTLIMHSVLVQITLNLAYFSWKSYSFSTCVPSFIQFESSKWQGPYVRKLAQLELNKHFRDLKVVYLDDR